MTKNKKLRKYEKHLSSKKFKLLIEVLLIDVEKPTVSFKSLSKVETTRINQ